MKQNASITIKSRKISEKALLLHSNFNLDAMSGSDSFKALCSLFVPKASLKEKMPKLALTMQVSDSHVRPVTNSAEEMRDFLLEMASWVDQNAEKVNKALETEQDAWLEMQNAYLNARKEQKDAKIYRLKQG